LTSNAFPLILGPTIGTEGEILSEIKVGQAVDIVLEQGVIKPSSIQDIIDERIILLQTAPPLAESYINKTILITYITREERQIRMGFPAMISEMREGYVTVGRGFPAIIVKPLSASAVCDLRAHTRQVPRPEMTVKLGAEDLEIIDISEGSAHLVRTSGMKATLQVDDIICLIIQSGQGKYVRQARIVRQWLAKGIAGPEHLAVIFIKEKFT
jgi:hypothetical protein